MAAAAMRKKKGKPKAGDPKMSSKKFRDFMRKGGKGKKHPKMSGY